MCTSTSRAASSRRSASANDGSDSTSARKSSRGSDRHRACEDARTRATRPVSGTSNASSPTTDPGPSSIERPRSSTTTVPSRTDERAGGRVARERQHLAGSSLDLRAGARNAFVARLAEAGQDRHAAELVDRHSGLHTKPRAARGSLTSCRTSETSCSPSTATTASAATCATERRLPPSSPSQEVPPRVHHHRTRARSLVLGRRHGDVTTAPDPEDPRAPLLARCLDLLPVRTPRRLRALVLVRDRARQLGPDRAERDRVRRLGHHDRGRPPFREPALD